MQQQAALVEPQEGTVACLGSGGSAVGRGQAFDLVGELELRPRNHALAFRDFCAGADLVEDVLLRVPDVIANAPDKVVVWVGGNDVLASLSPKALRMLRLGRRSRPPPTPAGFRDTLAAIVRRLKMGTEAQVALCSLAPIGEDPAPVGAFQAELNRGVAEYSAYVAEIAHAEHCAYIPVGEALAARIEDEPGRPYAGLAALSFCRDAFRAAAFRLSPDQIGERNGWRHHSDGLHLNTRAGLIAADLVQRFLDA